MNTIPGNPQFGNYIRCLRYGYYFFDRIGSFMRVSPAPGHTCLVELAPPEWDCRQRPPGLGKDFLVWWRTPEGEYNPHDFIDRCCLKNLKRIKQYSVIYLGENGEKVG